MVTEQLKTGSLDRIVLCPIAAPDRRAAAQYCPAATGSMLPTCSVSDVVIRPCPSGVNYQQHLAQGGPRVKIGMPAVLTTASTLTTAVTACSNSPPATATKLHHGVSAGITVGPGVAVALSNPVCRRFQQDLKVWETAIAEPGDVSTLLLNASARSACLKFGYQPKQLSHTKIGGKNSREVARIRRDPAPTASLVTKRGAEPLHLISGMQHQQRVPLFGRCDRQLHRPHRLVAR